MPSLRRLNCNVLGRGTFLGENPDTIFCAKFLLHNLEHFQAVVDVSIPNSQWPARSPFSDALYNQCPDLQSANIRCSGRDILPILAALSNLRQLRSLSFGMHSSDLEPLNLSILRQVQTAEYRSLRTLYLYGSVPLLTSIVQSIQSPTLEQVDVELYHVSFLDQLDTLLTAMTANVTYKTSIRSLSVAHKRSRHFTQHPTLSVRNLLAFSDLRYIKLLNLVMRLDDDVLHDISRAFPRLDVLSLSIRSIPGYESTATLRGLIPFGEHCPYISSLRLRFPVDVTIIPEVIVPLRYLQGDGTGVTQSHKTPLFLELGNGSALRNPEAVASFFLTVFRQRPLKVEPWPRLGRLTKSWVTLRACLSRMQSSAEGT
ncbi:hypothetical protein HYDPIDRAFT_24967 [Hydnomerulius pinastri MD-312]|nr:hypothetical protein HYDPIDRAFT_24967 [Hydnomerulius pinastri MD-312]